MSVQLDIEQHNVGLRFGDRAEGVFRIVGGCSNVCSGNCCERDDAVCLGGVAGGETAESDDGASVFQSVSKNSEGVSADDRDRAGFGTGIVDRIDAVESGDCDEAFAEYFFDIGDGEVGEGNGEFDGGFESGECEVAGPSNANRAGVDERRLCQRAKSVGAQRLGGQKGSCAAKEVMACSSLGNLPRR